MEILNKLDFVQILSIGISGFGFLLILLAFLLIYREQNRPQEPRKGIISTIRYFMALNFLSVVVVGFFGLPLISKNEKLKDENALTKTMLTVRANELQVVQNANDFDQLIDTAKTSSLSTEQIAKADAYVQSLDSLVGNYSTTDSVKADSLNKFKIIISDQVDRLKSDTSSAVTKNKALERINLINHKLTKLVRTREE